MNNVKFILVTGPPGSGKTVLSEYLSRKLIIPYLDYDLICQPFLKSIENRFGRNQPLEEFYQSWRNESYAAIMDTAISNLKKGVSVILSAPFSKERKNHTYFSTLKLERKLNFTSYNFMLSPSPEMLKENLSKRNSERDQDKLTSLDSYIATLDNQIHWDADYIFTLDIGVNDSLITKANDCLHQLLGS